MDFIDVIKILKRNPTEYFVAMPEEHVQFDPPEADRSPADFRDDFAIVRHADFGGFEPYQPEWRPANWRETGISSFPLPNYPQLTCKWVVMSYAEYLAERNARLKSKK